MVDKLSRVLFASYGLKVTAVSNVPKFSYYMTKGGKASTPEMDLPHTFLSFTINMGDKNNLFPLPSRTAFVLQNEYYTLLETWMEVYRWFSREDMKDLFLVGEDKKLQFNTAYNSYYRTVSDSRKAPNTQKITVLPTLVHRMDTDMEGVMIHFRILDIQTSLTIQEFGTLVHALQDFSFANEAFKVCMAYWYAEHHKNILDAEGFKNLQQSDPNRVQTNEKIEAILQGKSIDQRMQGKSFQLR